MSEKPTKKYIIVYFILAIFFIIGSLRQLNSMKDSTNGIRQKLYIGIVENYELVVKSFENDVVITLDDRNEAIMKINDHGYEQLNDDETIAGSYIIDAVNSKYLLDNKSMSEEERTEIMNNIKAWLEYIRDNVIK
jgi:hypothetical protein